MTTQTRTATILTNPGDNLLSQFTTSDNVRALVGIAQLSGFGFTVPTGSTINSITISVEGWIGTSQGGEFYAGPTKDGGATLAGTEIQDTGTWFTSESVINYGPSLFGTTWTAEEINAATFGARLRSFDPGGEFGSSYEIDYVEITVDYTPGVVSATGPCKIFGAESDRNIQLDATERKDFTIFKAKKHHE